MAFFVLIYMTNRARNRKTELLVFAFFGLLAFLYVAYRAYEIAISNDEAFSYFLVKTNYLKAMVSTANTHWLNSFFLKINTLLFGDHVLSLRVHSVLAFVLYAWFVLKIGRSFLHSTILVLIPVFMVNHFTLEYFSLARGYALSLAFLLASIYYALKFIFQNSLRKRDFNTSLIFGVLAVYANYSSLFQFVGIMSFQLVMLWKKEKSLLEIWKFIGVPNFLLIVSTGLLSVGNLLMIKFINNDLRYGGDYSFFTDTLDGIIHSLTYEMSAASGASHLSWSSVAFFLFMLMALLVGIRKKSYRLIFVAALFFFQFVINYLLFFLFKTPFPLYRTATILIPSIGLSIVFLMDELIHARRVLQVLSLGILLLSSWFVMNSAHIDSTFEWPWQSKMDEAICNLEHKKGEEKTRVLMSSHVYGVWQNYYRLNWEEASNFQASSYDAYIDSIRPEMYSDYDYLITFRPMHDKQLKQVKTYPLNWGIEMYMYKKME